MILITAVVVFGMAFGSKANTATADTSAAKRTVVIDPGHGSAVNKTDYEGVRELAIGLKLKADLEQKGYKVVMTHSAIGTAIGGVGSGSSVEKDNIARANIANTSQADLTVRLHSDDRSDDRFVILYPDKTAKDPYGFSGPQNTSIIPKSKSAASAVQSALSKAGYNGSTVGETIGFRTGGMIQTFSAHSSYPGITLELFGHNSTALMNKYAQSSEQDKVAKALADGINTYIGGSGSSSAQNGSSQALATGERLASANPKCPTEAPNPGPSSGEDVQAQVARAYQEQLSQAAAEQAAVSGKCTYDETAEQAIVDAALKYAPGSDGITKVKYVSGGRGPSGGFDCSGFVDYVLKKAKAAGADISVGSTILSTAYASVGQVVHKIDKSAFTLPSGGAKLRTQADMPKLEDLRPGDIIFFGTSTACSDKSGKKCPNTIGHLGIYLGDGKFIHSTSSDKDLKKDSASSANATSSPPFTAHQQGSLYSRYNGVKIDSLYDSYFTPGLYIQVNRVTKPKDCESGTTFANVDFGRTAYPGGANASVSFSSCHGSSTCHPAEDSGHGAYQNRPNGDAVDITPPSGYAYAVFDGTATKGGSGRNSYTAVRSQNGRAIAYYYHTNNVTTGSVKAGQKIAKTGAGGINHIHFELVVDGQSVHGALVYRASEPAYVKSLWNTMKMVLGLT
jgi:cell wall-associated NlpC family hydrolase